MQYNHSPQKHCEGCPFGGPKVGSKGNPTATLVIVGESPGAQEVRTGIPFNGPSGKVLHNFIPTEECFIVNAMECSPHKRVKDLHSVAAAARTCHNRLISQIQLVPRKVIVALGNAAVWSLTGNYGYKITQIRGRLIPSPLAEYGILPVIHPAALMRGTGNYRQFRSDLIYARELDQGKITPREHDYVEPTYFRAHISQIVELIARADSSNKPIELTGDIETSGFNPRHDRIIDFGFAEATAPDSVWVVRPELLHDKIDIFKKLLEHENIKWCWHNGKFDIKFFRQLGINARVDDDTMLMSYAMDENRGVHDLETVASDAISAPDYKDMLKPYLPNKQTSYEVIPIEVLDKYMAIDVGNTAKIRNIYSRRVNEDAACHKLYTKTLIPASECISRIEDNGIYVDQDWIRAREEYYVGEDGVLKELGNRINDICGTNVNPNSPQQMQEVLYGQFRLPKRGTGSTDKDTLNKFVEHPRTRLPIVLALLEYRKYAKAYGTYVKGMWPHIDPDTGRIYATYLLHGTITGRLASKNPNLQNIPRDPMLRGMFCASPGYKILEVDLSQAELRSLAALSGDPVMVDLYLAGRDIHTELAEFLFGNNWTKEDRVKCKNVNFGIIYGITKWGLMDQIKDTADIAQEMIEGWAARFPVAWEFIQKCRAAPGKGQTITTCFGRRKRAGLITSQNLRFLQNESANFPHQSVASDITLHAATRLEPYLRSIGVKIVNLVHDSIISEVPDDNNLLHHTAHLVSKTLEKVPVDWGITRVPFVADAELGERWGHNKEFKFEAIERIH